MDTGQRNLKGRVVYMGPRGGLYVVQGTRKIYKRANERLIRYPAIPSPGGPTRYAALVALSHRKVKRRR